MEETLQRYHVRKIRESRQGGDTVEESWVRDHGGEIIEEEL